MLIKKPAAVGEVSAEMRFNLYKTNEVRKELWKQGHAGSLMQRATFTDHPVAALVSTPRLDLNYSPEEKTGTCLDGSSDFNSNQNKGSCYRFSLSF